MQKCTKYLKQTDRYDAGGWVVVRNWYLIHSQSENLYFLKNSKRIRGLEFSVKYLIFERCNKYFQ